MKVAKYLTIVLLLFVSNAWGAVHKSAETPEQIFKHWLSAFNRGDEQALLTISTKYGMQRDAARDIALHESMGRFKILEFMSSTSAKVEVVVLVEASERALLATVTLDQAKPSEVSLFQLEGMEMPVKYRPKRMKIASLTRIAKQRLERLAASDSMYGALIVAKDNKILLQWQGGLADREVALPISTNTQFRLASLNKMFTAVAVLQLVEAGKLTLDGTISRYLPDYPNPSVAKSITLRQLLNHTSGLGDIFGEDFSTYSQALRTHTDYINQFSATPPEHAPGTQDGYSNYGYIVLGAVIEAVSGQSYYDYVDEHIYRIAGMKSTGSNPESMPVPGRAVAYARKEGIWQAETASLPWRGMAAGGAYSTVADILRFAEALRTGKLLSPALIEAATTAQNHKHWYGYGFMVSGQGKERQYGHEGGAPGANTALVVFPSEGYVVVGLSNTDPDLMENMVNFIARRLPLDSPN
ncbi:MULTISPECIES: serine hydrolase domain-containing protein [Xanthomonas]|uniref:Beta-lactamase family protein n=1 Tax=Xanthomonas cucurbitae TaxID=56453 RepID=A0ABY7YF99_9XANT|nr:serine hydrolase domain-containing protein [Xanthomonas cucurbitae]QHG86416.1 class A beta-lactamase-related serine hydrolase [Xanthomonas cucurbitae]WDM68675.1 beta-lactamase family protein [Xanthomonas cucurbitae]WDM72548.1 beta-lactamase family protein [Xanthomonas cucurbitae]WDM76332.1 beta-lactamase family protein [Xanthomonas cucurbitae]